MGLADLLGTDNPFQQFVASNRGRLGQIGAGLGSGQNFSAGLANAAQNMPLGAQQDDAYATAQKAEAERQRQLQEAAALKDKYVQFFTQQNQPRYAQAVADGIMDPGAAYGDWMRAQAGGQGDLSSTTQGRAQLAQLYGLDPQSTQEFVLTGKLPGGNATVRAGVGQPIYGRNKQTGAVEPWQSMTDGTMVNTANPTADPGQYDFNPSIAAGERASGAGDAKTAVAARAALPAAEQAFSMAKRVTDSLLTDTQGMSEQFGSTLGIPNQKLPAWPQSPMARFRTALEQGQGNAFLQARNVLKGAGQVTDYEGAKAEAAYSRMQLAANNNNQQEFITAVQDFQQAVDEGYAKLRAAAQGGYAAGGPNISGQQPGGQTSSGLSWSIEP